MSNPTEYLEKKQDNNSVENSVKQKYIVNLSQFYLPWQHKRISRMKNSVLEI